VELNREVSQQLQPPTAWLLWELLTEHRLQGSSSSRSLRSRHSETAGALVIATGWGFPRGVQLAPPLHPWCERLSSPLVHLRRQQLQRWRVAKKWTCLEVLSPTSQLTPPAALAFSRTRVATPPLQLDALPCSSPLSINLQRHQGIGAAAGAI